MQRKEFTPDMLYGASSGGRVMDSSPVAVPVGFKKPETMEERLRRFIRMELSEEAERQGLETFEESQDFDIPDDPVDPSTPFEEFFDPVLGKAITPLEMERFEGEYRRQYLEAQADAISREDREEAIREHVRELKKKQAAPAAGGGSQSPPPPPQEGN